MTVKYGTQEWEDYVLSLLTKKEQVKDKKTGEMRPRANGLYRIACFLSDRIDVDFPVVSGPNEGFYGATVNCSVYIKNLKHIDEEGNETVIRECVNVESACHVDRENNPKFAQYCVASADSAAMGRALKRALCLNIYTSDEMLEKDDEVESLGYMTEAQKKAVINRCNDLGLDPEKVVMGEIEESIEDFEELNIKKETVKKVVKALYQFKNKEKEIPDNYLIKDD